MKEGRGEFVIEDGSGDGGRDEAKGLGSFLLGIDVNKGNGDEEQAPEIVDANGNGAVDLGEEKAASNGEVIGAEKASGNGKNEEFGVDGEYSVGDFVWGKIKSHPWWPGQIYDASDASDYAMKLKSEGKLLVAYFGDGTFAWCHPSQLRPFGENFEEMAKQSSSRNFAGAVDAAVDEIGRIIGSKMTCPCVPSEIRAELNRLFVVNGGVKENVCVPDVALEKLPSSCELLTNLKVEARESGTSSLLDIVMLKSWVLAFYRSKGIYHLASYPEPQLIEGLEDQKEDSMGMILNKGGPEDEEWLNHKPTSENKSLQKTKKKSMAEILEGEMKSKGTAPSKKSNQRTRPKRRRVAKLIESTPITQSVDAGTDEENDSGAEKEEDYKENAEDESDLRVETSDDAEAKDLKGYYVLRERKKSKYLCPPYTTTRTTPTLKVSVVLSSDSNVEASPKPKPKPDPKHEASAKDVLSEIKSLKIDPCFSRKTESFPVVEEFLHMFRSSVFSNDPKPGSEGEEGVPVVSGKKRKESDKTETEPRKKRIKKTETEKDGSKKSDDLGSARLLISFGPGSSLPSKEDLINIYGKFGPLDETKTNMYYNNFCGVVAFERSSDAESALTSSKDSSPFGTSNASFVLRPLSSPKKKPKPLKTPLKKLSEQEKKKFEFEFVKEKIKSMSSMLEKSEGNLSKEMRSRLEIDLKGVLEKVSAGAASVTVRGGGSSAT